MLDGWNYPTKCLKICRNFCICHFILFLENMAIFEAFCQEFSSSINFLFGKSANSTTHSIQKKEIIVFHKILKHVLLVSGDVSKYLFQVQKFMQQPDSLYYQDLRKKNPQTQHSEAKLQKKNHRYHYHHRRFILKIMSFHELFSINHIFIKKAIVVTTK